MKENKIQSSWIIFLKDENAQKKNLQSKKEEIKMNCN